jgi:hypothetical protein
MYPRARDRRTENHLYFYELHEGDEDLYGDAILAHEIEFTPEDFFDLVQQVRRRVQETFEEDTLVEAIARELEREHGFIYVSDERLTAAVHVSEQEEDNYLGELEPAEDEEGNDAFRSIYFEVDRGPLN